MVVENPKVRTAQRSRLQSIVKKAVVEAMKRRYRRDEFPEDGPEFRIEVALLKDRVTLTWIPAGPACINEDTGRKGARRPLRENLAAALVLLSKWGPHRNSPIPSADPGPSPLRRPWWTQYGARTAAILRIRGVTLHRRRVWEDMRAQRRPR
jgi:hypothetical protein